MSGDVATDGQRQPWTASAAFAYIEARPGDEEADAIIRDLGERVVALETALEAMCSPRRLRSRDQMREAAREALAGGGHTPTGQDSGAVSPQDRPAPTGEPGRDPVGTELRTRSGVPAVPEHTPGRQVTSVTPQELNPSGSADFTQPGGPEPSGASTAVGFGPSTTTATAKRSLPEVDSFVAVPSVLPGALIEGLREALAGGGYTPEIETNHVSTPGVGAADVAEAGE